MVLLAGLGLLVMGQASPRSEFEQVTAKRVTVVDDKGKPVVEMFRYGLQVMDENGKSVLRRGRGGGNLLIDNEQGKNVISLGVHGSRKSGRLYLANAQGHTVVALSADRRENGSLVLSNAGEQTRLWAGVDARKHLGRVSAYTGNAQFQRSWP